MIKNCELYVKILVCMKVKNEQVFVFFVNFFLFLKFFYFMRGN